MAKLRVSGGEDPVKGKPSSLSYDQINLWSDYVEKNPRLDFNTLWNGFSKKYPKAGIDKDILIKDLSVLRNNTQKAAERQGTDLSTINTGYSFPKAIFNGRDLGRVNANMITQQAPPPQPTYPASLIKKTVPSGVKDVWFDESKGLAAYENPQTGDIEYAEKSILNMPQFRKPVEQATADITKRTMLKTR
jgi:hypothetical protein